jgi:hypothetical protein
MTARQMSSILRSGKARAAAICCASSLAMVAMSPVSALEPRGDIVTPDNARYVQPLSFDVDDSFKSYNAAGQLMDGAAVVYKPTYIASLKRSGKIVVATDDLLLTDGRIAGGETYIGARYGTKEEKFTVHQKVGGTNWSSDEGDLFFCAGKEMCNQWWWGFPTLHPEWDIVDYIKLTLGDPGEESTVNARVFARCNEEPSGSQSQEEEAGRCEKSDVVDGAIISYTVKGTESDRKNRDKHDGVMAGTNIVIESEGLSYSELRSVAESMTPVSPRASRDSLLLVPVTMLSICEQAIAAGTFKAARQVANANGYTARVSSIDGFPQNGTADFRTDRINVELVGGRVASCTYG